MNSSVTEVSDVSLGEGKQQFMHTIIAGDASNPPLVCLPGYGAGAGFYFRNIDGLAKQFRVHLVDLLGTGMSGEILASIVGGVVFTFIFMLQFKSWRLSHPEIPSLKRNFSSQNYANIHP